MTRTTAKAETYPSVVLHYDALADSSNDDYVTISLSCFWARELLQDLRSIGEEQLPGALCHILLGLEREVGYQVDTEDSA